MKDESGIIQALIVFTVIAVTFAVSYWMAIHNFFIFGPPK